MVLKEFELGPEAIAYIREQLAAGLTLARQMERLPLEQGRVRSYLPAELSAESRTAFHRSVYLSTQLVMKPEVLALVMRHIGTYLGLRDVGAFRNGGEHYAVFETYFRADEPGVVKGDLPYFSSNDEVYHFLTSQNRDQEAIQKAMRNVRDYPFVCSLTTMPPQVPVIHTGQAVDPDTLAQLASRTAVLIIGAYDNEGYLLWNRRHTM